METTIDKAGRVVIPAAMRRKAGLSAGTALEITIEEGSIRISRKVPGPKLVRVGNRWVAKPTADPRHLPILDPARLIEEERNRWP